MGLLEGPGVVCLSASLGLIMLGLTLCIAIGVLTRMENKALKFNGINGHMYGTPKLFVKARKKKVSTVAPTKP